MTEHELTDEEARVLRMVADATGPGDSDRLPREDVYTRRELGGLRYLSLLNGMYCRVSEAGTAALAAYDARKAQEPKSVAVARPGASSTRRGWVPWVSWPSAIVPPGTVYRASAGIFVSKSERGLGSYAADVCFWTGCPQCERPDPHEHTAPGRPYDIAFAGGGPAPLPMPEHPARDHTGIGNFDAARTLDPAKLARALFNRRMRQEAERHAEPCEVRIDGPRSLLTGNPREVTYRMWCCETAIRTECEAEAAELVKEMER